MARTSLAFRKLTADNYPDFLKIKTIPRYEFSRNGNGWTATFPAEYANRLGINAETTIEPMPLPLSDFLFDRQQVAVRVSWHKQRYALFWDAGLGKTLVFLELARQYAALGKKCLIVSPLNIIPQTIEECEKHYPDLDIINYHGRRDEFHRWRESVGSSIVGVINQMSFRQPVDLSGIDAVFLDESSILRNPHGTLRKNLIQCCSGIPYKFAYSATQAPNDRVEYAQVAMWLEVVRSDTEFRAMFFVQKDQGWVLRRHRVKGFYDFLSSFSMFMRNPEVYGFENNLGLRPYREIREKIEITPGQTALVQQSINNQQASLPGIPESPSGLSDRQIYNQASKGFLYVRENGRKEIVSVSSLKPVAIRSFLVSRPRKKAIVWTVYDEEGEIIYNDLNEHTNLVVALLTGRTPLPKRHELIQQFRHGEIDVMISKPRLLGMGLNLHVASLVIFSGLQDSYEQFYQAMKRSWRYPQNEQVQVYLPYTQYEEPILDNVLGKRDQAEADFDRQERLYSQSAYDEIQEFLTSDDWQPQRREEKPMHDPITTGKYEIYHTDSIESTLNGVAENRGDLIVTSIPFRNDLFAYTDHVGDMGNSGGVGEAGRDEFLMHLEYCLRGMMRVLKPGRLACIEIAQSPLRLGVDGVIGISDFRGDVIRVAEKCGFITWAEIPVLKNPQAAAIVKHIATLTMANFDTDRAKLAPMMLDYILVFKNPGENETPVTGDDFGNFEGWIEHADGVWQEEEYNLGRAQYAGVNQQTRWDEYLDKFDIALKEALQILSGAFTDIDQTATLQTPYTRGVTKEIEDADKHVCPFSLPLVNRLIRLYSNPGETVIDPFGGVGSVLHEAIKLERFCISMELKAEYFLQSVEIAHRAATEARQMALL